MSVLRQVEAGARVAEICRKVGISEATYYLWKRQYSGVGVSELRELRQLREENGRLKRLVADISMDRQILQEIVSKSCKASSQAIPRLLGLKGVRAYSGRPLYNTALSAMLAGSLKEKAMSPGRTALDVQLGSHESLHCLTILQRRLLAQRSDWEGAAGRPRPEC